MSVQRIAKKIDADDKSITVVRKENGKIRLVYRGFGASNLTGNMTPNGKHPLQKKNTSITAGDIIEIRLSESVIDEYFDRVVPSGAVKYVNGGESFQQYSMYQPSTKETFHISLQRGPDEIEDVIIPLVVNEPIWVEGELKVGIDLFLDEAGWGADNKDTAKRRWTKEMLDAGLNFGHSTLLGGTWVNGFNELIIGKDDNGKFNLETFDEVNAPRMLGDIWHRRANGITDCVDIFDQIGFKDPARWARSPLNARNNPYGEIAQGIAFAGAGMAPPCDRLENWNKFERIIEGLCGTDDLQAIYKRHVEMIQGLLPEGTWICVGNETTERSTEREIISWISKVRNPVFTNNEHLWLGRYGDGEGWEVQDTIGQHIVGDHELFTRISGIRTHHAHPHTLWKQLTWLRPVLRQYPHLMIWVSTDGTRPRLSRDEQRQLLNAVTDLQAEFNIVALSYKTTSIEDTSSLIKYLGGLM